MVSCRRSKMPARRAYSKGAILPKVGIQPKTSSLESFFRMDHARIFKGTRSSVAAPHPFEIPLLAFVGRIPRTGFAGCCGRPSCVRLRRTFLILSYHYFSSMAFGFFEVDMGNYLMHKDFYIFRFY